MTPRPRLAGLMLFLVRLALAGAMVSILALALMPGSATPAPLFWDKAQHMLAFYVLTLLASAAAPRLPLLAVAALLAGFGLMIEALQAYLPTNRSAEWADFYADLAGIAAALAPIAVGRARRFLHGPP